MTAPLVVKQIIPENIKSAPKPLKSIKSLTRKKVWGFSMFETMVGIALMSLFFVYTIQIISQGYSANTKSMKYIGACSLTRQILEEYSSWPALDALDGSSNGVVTNNTYSYPSSTINNVTYSCNLIITDGPVAPTLLKQLTATVSWSGGSFSVYSLKSNY